MLILVVGDPIDGITLVGPFDDDDDHSDVALYAETHHKDDTWWITTLAEREDG